MRLDNQFVVPVSVDRTWEVLQDLEAIAPCLPGAQLEGVEGDDYKGVVKVKLGPVTVSYRGTVAFIERDAERRVAVLKAAARETRGAGSVNATITASLHEDGAGATRVEVGTDLNISGRAAQFGRGVLEDVSGKIMGQFAERLSAMIAESDRAVDQPVNGDAAPAAPAAPVEPAALELGGIIPWGRVAVLGGSLAAALTILLAVRRRCRRARGR